MPATFAELSAQYARERPTDPDASAKIEARGHLAAEYYHARAAASAIDAGDFDGARHHARWASIRNDRARTALERIAR
jgi:hypothetical protein